MVQPDRSQTHSHQQGLHSYEAVTCSSIAFDFVTLFLPYQDSTPLRSSSGFARVAADFSDLDIDIGSHGIPELPSSLPHDIPATGWKYMS